MSVGAVGVAAAVGIVGAVLAGVWVQHDETSRTYPFGDPVVVTDFQPLPDHPEVLRADVVLSRVLNQAVSIEARCTHTVEPARVEWVEDILRNRPVRVDARVPFQFRFSGDILALSRYPNDMESVAGTRLPYLFKQCVKSDFSLCFPQGTNITFDVYSPSSPASVVHARPKFVSTASGYRVDINASYYDFIARDDGFVSMVAAASGQIDIGFLATTWGVTMRVAGEQRRFQFSSGAANGVLGNFLTRCESTAMDDSMRMEIARQETGRRYLKAGLSAIAAEDWASASDQLHRAAGQGAWTARSALELGRLFHDGKGIALDPRSAWAWFRTAIDTADRIKALDVSDDMKALMSGMADYNNGAGQDAVKEAASQELCRMARRNEPYGGTPERDARTWCKADPSRPT